MGNRLTLRNITSGYQSPTTINANNADIETAIDALVSRTNPTGNQMGVNLDMNSNRILNLPDAVNNAEPVTLSQAAVIAGVTSPLTQNAVGDVLYPLTGEETTAGLGTGDIDSWELPGSLPRYKPVGGGSSDVANDTAITNWLSAGEQGLALTFGSEVDTYAITAAYTTFNQTGAITIVGNGSTLKGLTTEEFIDSDVSLTITGVNFDTWQRVIFSNQAAASTMDLLRVSYCVFKNIESNTINYQGTIDTMMVNNCWFEDVQDEVIQLGLNVVADQPNWRRLVVADNTFKGITGVGSAAIAMVLSYAEETIFVGNVGTEIDGTGATETWGIYTKSLRETITGNVIQMDPASVSPKCIMIKGDVRGGVTGAPFGYTGIVASNICVIGDQQGNGAGTAGGATSRGIQIANDEILCYGNYIEGAGQGIFTGGDGYDNITINNNIINGEDAVTPAGIQMTHTGINLQVIGNKIINCTNHGIWVDMNNGGITGYLIKDNIIDGADQCVRFDNASNAWNASEGIVTNNIFRNSTTGVREIGSVSPSLADSKIFDNHYDTMTNRIIFQNTLTGVEIREPFVPVTQAWDPAAVTNNSKASTTITVTGAQFGDTVEVGVSGDIQNLLLTSAISAADTVELTLSLADADDATGIDLGSLNYTAYVIQRQEG